MIEIKDQEEEDKASAVPSDPRLNVKKKKQIQVAKDGKPGDIAHTHHMENEYEEWDQPCPFVEFRVSVQGGIKLNENIYAGKVIVPQCTADYLAWQQSEKLRYEANLYRNNGRKKTVASL